MAPHSSILVWKIPWAEEPGQLPSIGSDMTELLSSFLLLLMASGCLQSDSVTDHTTRSLCRTCDPGSQVSGPRCSEVSETAGCSPQGSCIPSPQRQ